MLQNSNPPKLSNSERDEKIDYNYIKNSEIIIGTYQEAPKFLQDNEFIHNGYLINTNTYSKIFKSLFICHNETVNIWSHLLGALFFIFLIWYTSVNITNFNSQLVYVKNDISLIENKYLNESNFTNISPKAINNIYNSIKGMKIDLENFNYKNIYDNTLNQISLINNNNNISDINKTNDNIT